MPQLRTEWSLENQFEYVIDKGDNKRNSPFRFHIMFRADPAFHWIE